MQSYVAGFLFSRDRENVLLIRKNKPEWQAGRLNGIGGKVEVFDDTFEQAQTREFHEEAGLFIPPHRWERLASIDFGDAKVKFFSAFDVDDVFYQHQQMEEEEIVPVRVEDVPQLGVIDNLRWLIPAALDSNTPKPLFAIA